MLLVGDAGVGKSAFILKLADNVFTNSFISTIGVDFKIINAKVDDQLIKLQVNNWSLEIEIAVDLGFRRTREVQNNRAFLL